MFQDFIVHFFFSLFFFLLFFLLRTSDPRAQHPEVNANARFKSGKVIFFPRMSSDGTSSARVICEIGARENAEIQLHYLPHKSACPPARITLRSSFSNIRVSFFVVFFPHFYFCHTKHFLPSCSVWVVALFLSF